MSRLFLVGVLAAFSAVLLIGCHHKIVVPHSPCRVGSEVACVKMLNEIYSGFDENNDSSPLGVTLRARPRFDDEGWYYCTGQCYRGQPDCLTSGSLLNHKMMLKDGKLLLPEGNNMGVIIQPYAAEHVVTKCAYEYDGASFEKNNGGCSLGTQSTDCDSKYSAYQNGCPEDTSKHATEDECPSVLNAWCGKNLVDYPGTCSWRGPAWYSPTHANATPDASRLDNVNELRKMTAQRIRNQGGKKCGDCLCTEYWNEMTMDGRFIKKLISQHPSDVIAAFAYRKGNKEFHNFAKQFNDQLERQTGFRVPIISIDMSMNVVNLTAGAGPFGLEEGELSTQVV